MEAAERQARVAFSRQLVAARRDALQEVARGVPGYRPGGVAWALRASGIGRPTPTTVKRALVSKRSGAVHLQRVPTIQAIT